MSKWVTFAGGLMLLDPDASEFERLMSCSQWEWRKVALLQEHLKPGDTFIDAGAHWGYFSLIAAARGARVMAFEPELENYRRLLDNFQANNYLLEAWLVALWDTDSVVSLYRGYNTGTHSLVKDYRGVIEPVSTRTLDNVLNGRLPAMMKVDVEGADIEVLRGAQQTLRTAEHMVILMDLHPELGVDTKTVGELLHTFGFKLYDIRSGNAPLDTVPGDLVELLAIKGGYND